MAQEFIINGTTLNRVTFGDWVDEPGDSQALGSITAIARWRRLVWQAREALSMTEWNTLRAYEGQRVTVTAPPYGDRNAADYATYYGAAFDRLSGRHEGPIVIGVQAEFLVRL